MKAKSCSEFQQDLAAILDTMTEHHEPMIITRDHGKPAVVLMSVEDFASLEESHYLLQSPRNADRPLEAVRKLQTDHRS